MDGKGSKARMSIESDAIVIADLEEELEKVK